MKNLLTHIDKANTLTSLYRRKSIMNRAQNELDNLIKKEYV